MKMYGTTFKGIYRLFLDITRTFIQIITNVAVVIAIAAIEMKIYGTTFKGIYRLFLEITLTFIKIITFPLNFISLQIYKLIFFAKIQFL